MGRVSKNHIFIGGAVVLLFAIFLLVIVLTPSKPKPNSTNSKSPAYHVRDDSLGITFDINNNFERIPSAELDKLNPSFVYGFRPKGENDTSCIISQSKRLKPGVVTADELAKGTFNEIKKSFSDAQALTAKKILLGAKDAAILEITYTQNGKKFHQVEVVATTDIRTTFAFCTTPEPLIDLYSGSFHDFLHSLRVK